MNDSARQIRVGAVISYITVAFTALTGLLYTPWMVHTIGADDFGIYALAISITTLFLSDYGIGEATTRFLAKHYAEGHADLADRLLATVFKIYAVIALILFIVFAVVFAFIDSIYANLAAGELAKFKDIFLIVAACSVLGVPLWPFGTVMASNERFIAMRLCNLIGKVAGVASIIVLLLMGHGVFAVVLVNAGMGLLFSVIQVFLALRLTSARPRWGKARKGEVKDLLGFSVWTLTVQICQRFIFSVMPSVLAITTDAWAIAIFGLASSLEGYVWNIGNALGGLFMPRISRILAGNEGEGTLQQLFERFGRVQLHVIGLVLIGFVALGGQFVDCWMGEDYHILYACVLLLIVPAFIELPTMIGNTALVAAGEVKYRAFMYLVMAVVNIALGFVLSSLFGIVGACASICAAYLVRTLGMWVMYTRRLGLDLGSFARRVYPSWIVPAAVSLAVGFALLAFDPLAGWLGLVVNAFVMTAVYGALCWLVSLRDGEKRAVRDWLGRKLRRR